MTTKYKSLDFKEQITFFRNKVNVPTATWRDVWREGHDKAFMVAGAFKADLLNDFNKAIDKAIAQGTTIAEFRKDFDRIVETHGWSYNGGRGWRSRVIFETNLRTSYQAGRYAQLTNPKLLKSRPYWRYKHSDSVQHPRPLHLKWNDTILHYSDPWWKTHFCPNGWGCKCKIFAESERTMRRLGKDGPDVAPDDGLVDGRPAGIDEGWNYAPGASVDQVVRDQIVAKKLDKLPRSLSVDFIADQFKNEVFDHWYSDPKGLFPVAMLPDEQVALINARTAAVVISEQTIIKQQKRHPDLKAVDYAAAQLVVDEGLVIPDGDKSLVYLLDDEDTGLVMVVKATKTGKAVFLQSLRKLSRDEAKRDREVRRLKGKLDKN